MTTAVPAAGELPTKPERLRRFFAPRGVALVGASDTSGWGRNVVESLETSGFGGPVVMVHPRHQTAFGRPTRPSLRDLDEPVDLAFVLAPPNALEDVLEDAAAASVGGVVVVAAGFGERGEEGRALERRLVERATAHGITLLGPNGLGFVNATEGVAPYGLKLQSLQPGPVGVVLQSGALASAVLGFAHGHGIGTSLTVSMGNEAMVTTADVIDHLLEDEATRVIALFLEGIRQPERFRALAEKALQVRKPLVALKVGRSPGGVQAALAHTGAVAGDDAVVDAALRQLGVVRVQSLEELLVTAHLLGTAPPLPGRRMGVVTASGGACDIIVDRAHEEGIEIPPFTPETERRLAEILPDFTNASNPVDATGFGLANVVPGAKPPLSGALAAVVEDTNVDFVLNLGVMLPPTSSVAADVLEQRFADIAAQVRSAPVPVVSTNTSCVDMTDWARQALGRHGLDVLAGLDLTLSALGHAVRWEEGRRRAAGRGRPADPEPAPAWRGSVPEGPWSEWAGRALLAEAGVPLVPAELATTAGEAAAAARRLGFPVALKLCSAQIAHKSDLGGVALGLRSATAVREAFGRVLRAGEAAPDADIEGVLVSPMREGGHELLAGVTVDPTFGPVLAVGLGGVWVELLGDTALRVLPVTRADVLDMLGELRGAAVLRGARGGSAVDVELVAGVLVRLAGAALSLQPSLVAVELNPLWCRGDVVEGLDVLVQTRIPAA
jgi:acetate---CoA ligase (ADP-forming)